MPINLIAQIKQKNSAVFPLVDDADLLAGFRVCVDEAARDAIPANYRRLGMFVWTDATQKLWRLSALPNTWTEFTGGTSSGTQLTDAMVSDEAVNEGDPVALNPLTGRVYRSDAHEIAGNRQEVWGLATSSVLAAGQPISVVTSGVMAYTPGGLAPGDILYIGVGLGIGGGFTNNPVPILATSGRRLTRIGQVRTASSILVRVQVIAQT